MHKQLSNFAELRLVEVDGTDNQTHGVDTANYDGVLFMVRAASADLEVHAIQDDSLDGSDELLDDASDIEDSKVEADNIGEVIWIDIYRPDERYVAIEFNDDSHIDNDNVFALRYHSRNRPIDNNVAEAAKGTQLVSPDEGTP